MLNREDIQFEPLQDLFTPGQGVTKELFKQDVLDHFKRTQLIGVPDVKLQISFSPEDDGAILVTKVDREKALGYSVYADDQEYYSHLSASLYTPSQEEIAGAMNG